MRYELKDLRLFVAIADAHSLSAGADALHMTASSASYRLKKLELATGVSLCTRSSRGMILSPAGISVLSHARKILADIDCMHEEIGGYASGTKGTVRLFANSSGLNSFVAPSLVGFLSLYPNINVNVEERPSHTILEAIAAQEGDIGIFGGQLDSDAVTSECYAVNRMVLVTPLGHPLINLHAIRFSTTLDADFVCMSQQSSNYIFVIQQAQRAGKKLNVRMHAHNFDALLRLVEAAIGIALVPANIAAPAVAQGTIAAVSLDEPWALRTLNLITNSGIILPAVVQTTDDYLLNDPLVAQTRSDL